MNEQTQLFTQLTPKKTRFLVGENPAPTKFSGSFKQIEGAFSMLESFLGNGIDFHVTDNRDIDGNLISISPDRKMLFNISSAIGRTDKLYKPINLIPSLKFVSDVWGGDVTSFSDEILTFTIDSFSIGIPVNARNGYEFGIYYKGKGSVLGLDGVPNWIDLEDNGSVYKWKTISISTAIKFFKLKRTQADKEFHIKSLYVIDKSIYNGVYNKAYCPPLDNKSYFTLKVPCKYSNPESSQLCVKRTCNYCIGHLYDMNEESITYGSPKCESLNSNAASGAYWNNSGTPVSISYVAEPAQIEGVNNPRSNYITIQSPLNLIGNQYTIRYKPFHIHNKIQDAKITDNSSVIYDIKNSSSTIKYLTKLYSAGPSTGNIRSDIAYIKDGSEVSDGIGDPRRYLVIGGNYGFLDLIFDIMPFINLPVPHEAIDTIAVYAE